MNKCEAVGSVFDSEINLESKSHEEASDPKKQKLEHSPVTPVNDVKTDVSTGITLKPKQDFLAKSASQIMSEQRGK